MSLKEEERRIVIQLELEKADYNCFFQVAQSDISARIEPTRQFIDHVREYVGATL